MSVNLWYGVGNNLAYIKYPAGFHNRQRIMICPGLHHKISERYPPGVDVDTFC